MLQRSLYATACVVVSIVLFGCGGGSGKPDEPGSGSSVVETVAYQGQVIKGLVANAQVTVYSVAEKGLSELASGSTDDTGAFDIQVPVHEGPVLIEAQGKADLSSKMKCDTYTGCGSPNFENAGFDENQNGVVDFGEWMTVSDAFKLSAVLNVEEKPLGPIVLSPLTHAAALSAQARELTEQAVATANTFVAHWARLDGELPYVASLDVTDLENNELESSKPLKHAVLSSSALMGESTPVANLNRFASSFADCQINDDEYPFRDYFRYVTRQLRYLAMESALPSNHVNEVFNEVAGLHLFGFEATDEQCLVDYDNEEKALDKVKQLVEDFRSVATLIDEHEDQWQLDTQAFGDDIETSLEALNPELGELSNALSWISQRLIELDEAGFDWENGEYSDDHLVVDTDYEEESLNGDIITRDAQASIRYTKGDLSMDLALVALDHNNPFDGTVMNPVNRHARLSLNGAMSTDSLSVKLNSAELNMEPQENGIYRYDPIYYYDPEIEYRLADGDYDVQLTADVEIESSTNGLQYQGGLSASISVESKWHEDIDWSEVEPSDLEYRLYALALNGDVAQNGDTLSFSAAVSDLRSFLYFYDSYYSEGYRYNYDGMMTLSFQHQVSDLPDLDVTLVSEIDGDGYKHEYDWGYGSENHDSESSIENIDLRFAFEDTVVKLDMEQDNPLTYIRSADDAQLVINLTEEDDEQVGYVGLNYPDSPIYGYIYDSDGSYMIRYQDGSFESLLPASLQ